eukprot:XP_001690495.1 predicted protein [Chlamydomonas reinhardtii]
MEGSELVVCAEVRTGAAHLVILAALLLLLLLLFLLRSTSDVGRWAAGTDGYTYGDEHGHGYEPTRATSGTDLFRAPHARMGLCIGPAYGSGL